MGRRIHGEANGNCQMLFRPSTSCSASELRVETRASPTHFPDTGDRGREPPSVIADAQPPLPSDSFARRTHRRGVPMCAEVVLSPRER